MPLFGANRLELEMLKDLSAPEKLRNWESQEQSLAPSDQFSLPRHRVPLCGLHPAPVILARLVFSGKHSKIKIFLRFLPFARVSVPQCLSLYFPRSSLASCFSNHRSTWQCGSRYV